MPDSLPPPSWGIPSYDERDLDALLSGEVADIPVALHPLAETLTALNGPPTPAELGGQAPIMAEFRGRHAETLELPAPQPSGRHRVRRSPNRRFGAFLAAAAAVAIVGAFALTGNLPEPHHSSASHLAASSAAAKPKSPNLQDRSASSERDAPHNNGERSAPSPSPSVGASPNANKLCRAFYWSFEHSVNGQQQWLNSLAFRQLSAQAGGSGHILSFCQPYLKDMFPHGVPGDLWGSLGTSQLGQGSQGGDMAPDQNARYRF